MTPVAPRTERLVYIDALRVGAIMVVFVIHVCEVFNPWDEWHITNAERSRLAGEVAVLSAPWIMPLVMLLAGVSAWHSLRHRATGAYIRERAIRLLVPLAIGTLVLVPPQVYLERRLRGQFSGSFLEFYPHFFDGIYPTGNFSSPGTISGFSPTSFSIRSSRFRCSGSGSVPMVSAHGAGPLG